MPGHKLLFHRLRHYFPTKSPLHKVRTDHRQRSGATKYSTYFFGIPVLKVLRDAYPAHMTSLGTMLLGQVSVIA
jgi:hypothetical protein